MALPEFEFGSFQPLQAEIIRQLRFYFRLAFALFLCSQLSESENNSDCRLSVACLVIYFKLYQILNNKSKTAEYV